MKSQQRGLKEYVRKRDFTLTPEPSGSGKTGPNGRGKSGTSAKKPARSKSKLSFVVQKHAASRLHYDFRLEHDGVLMSWAVPKGPSLDPADKRLAVHVEDHPLDYGGFEGTIPQGQYGGGSVIVWDRGHWTPDGDPTEMMRRGKLDFTLHGKKLGGAWHMVRLKGRDGEGDKNWLLMKRTDEFVKSGKSIVDARPESVKSGRLIEEIGARHKVWNSNRSENGAKKKKKTTRARTSRSSTPRRSAGAKTLPRAGSTR
jgi:bifunctional non-homologous end joining protein LigD